MEKTKRRVAVGATHVKTLDYGDLTNKILVRLISYKRDKNLQNLRGKISFRDDYDYKSLRN